MIFALRVDVEDGITGGFVGTGSDNEFRMDAGNCLQDLRVGKFPCLIGRVPRATFKWLIDVPEAMEESEKL